LMESVLFQLVAFLRRVVEEEGVKASPALEEVGGVTVLRALAGGAGSCGLLGRGGRRLPWGGGASMRKVGCTLSKLLSCITWLLLMVRGCCIPPIALSATAVPAFWLLPLPSLEGPGGLLPGKGRKGTSDVDGSGLAEGERGLLLVGFEPAPSAPAWDRVGELGRPLAVRLPRPRDTSCCRRPPGLDALRAGGSWEGECAVPWIELMDWLRRLWRELVPAAAIRLLGLGWETSLVPDFSSS